MGKPKGKGIRAWVEWEVRKDGKVISKGRKEAHSWVKNLARIFKILSGKEPITLYDIYGDAHDVYRIGFKNSTAEATEGSDKLGVVVGSGGTPPTKEDTTDVYWLANPISHGDGDNLLHYYESIVLDIAVSNTTVTLKWSRDFKNNGSVDVNIGEVGLVFMIGVGADASTSEFFLLFHESLASPVTVPPGATITWRVVLEYTK